MGKTKRQSANAAKTVVRNDKVNTGFNRHWDVIGSPGKVTARAEIAPAGKAVPAVIHPNKYALASSGLITAKASMVGKAVTQLVSSDSATVVSKGAKMTSIKEENPQYQSRIFLLSKLLLEGHTKELEGLFGENKEFIENYIGKSNEEIKEALEGLIDKFKKDSKNRLKL